MFGVRFGKFCLSRDLLISSKLPVSGNRVNNLTLLSFMSVESTVMLFFPLLVLLCFFFSGSVLLGFYIIFLKNCFGVLLIYSGLSSISFIFDDYYFLYIEWFSLLLLFNVLRAFDHEVEIKKKSNIASNVLNFPLGTASVASH